MVDVGVLVSGNGTNLQSIIDSIEAKRCSARIKVVISNRTDAFALKRAGNHGIPTEVIKKEDYPSREAYDTELAERLKKHGVGLVVLAGFMRIITRPMLDAFHMRIINIHPALLPSFPGLDVQRKAIEHGVKFSGCTVHFVDEGVDSGPIIIQAVVPVKDNDTAESLSKRILDEEHRIYPEAIHLISEGRLSVMGRRVIVKDGPEPTGALENPPVTIFADKTRP